MVRAHTAVCNPRVHAHGSVRSTYTRLSLRHTAGIAARSQFESMRARPATKEAIAPAGTPPSASCSEPQSSSMASWLNQSMMPSRADSLWHCRTRQRGTRRVFGPAAETRRHAVCRLCLCLRNTFSYYLECCMRLYGVRANDVKLYCGDRPGRRSRGCRAHPAARPGRARGQPPCPRLGKQSWRPQRISETHTHDTFILWLAGVLRHAACGRLGRSGRSGLRSQRIGWNLSFV